MILCVYSEQIFSCFSFIQCVQCICNVIDRQDAAVSEEFYDNLVTCDIKSVDCLIGALLVKPSAVQRLKGDVDIAIFVGQFSPRGRGAIMLTLCEV